MAVNTQKLRHKPPSFSSSILDAIYRSNDDADPHTRKNGQDIESLRRAILIEKWISDTTVRAPKREAKAKVKEPISPGGKIANFFNSIFSPRNMKSSDVLEMRKSKSTKDAAKSSSRSCLTKNVSCGGSKSKRSVRFWIVDQDCGRKSNNVRSLGVYESSRYEFCRKEKDFDGMSCGSSDLFELDNIGREEQQELPVYGTTDHLQM